MPGARPADCKEILKRLSSFASASITYGAGPSTSTSTWQQDACAVAHHSRTFNSAPGRGANGRQRQEGSGNAPFPCHGPFSVTIQGGMWTLMMATSRRSSVSPSRFSRTSSCHVLKEDPDLAVTFDKTNILVTGILAAYAHAASKRLLADPAPQSLVPPRVLCG